MPSRAAASRLRGARRDQHLGVGVEVDVVEAALVAGDRFAEHGQAGAGWVLVEAAADGGDGGVEHLGRAVGVGEALPEVHGAGGRRQRRHLREDRRAEPGELGGQRWPGSHVHQDAPSCSAPTGTDGRGQAPGVEASGATLQTLLGQVQT
jgi:hypothetical protein